MIIKIAKILLFFAAVHFPILSPFYSPNKGSRHIRASIITSPCLVVVCKQKIEAKFACFSSHICAHWGNFESKTCKRFWEFDNKICFWAVNQTCCFDAFRAMYKNRVKNNRLFLYFCSFSSCDQGNPEGNLFSNFSKTNTVITHFLSYFYTCTGYYYNRFF